MILQSLALLRDIVTSLSSLASTIVAVVKQLDLLRPPGRGASYENLSLSLHLQILDAAGDEAELGRRQVVKFVASEAGVIRDIAWGDGEVLKRYDVAGAGLLGVRHEGSKKVLLVGLAQSPARGEQAIIRTSRRVTGALRGGREFLEVQLERVTQRLTLKVTFPSARRPIRAWSATSPPEGASRSLAVRLANDGRPYVSWCLRRPRISTTYRVVWDW